MSVRSEGFTLLELLVSMALLALVTGLIYDAFFQVSSSSVTVQSEMKGRQELRLLMKMVLDDLQMIRYLKYWADSDNKPETGLISKQMRGPEDSEVSTISFHAAVPSRFFRDVDVVQQGMDPHLHEIGYALVQHQTENRWQFVRREDFYLDENLEEPRPEGRSQVLSEEVTSFSVEFLSQEIRRAGGAVEENWESSWNSQEVQCVKDKSGCLPRAIRLKMKIKDASAREVEDLQEINLCVRPCDPEIFLQ